MANLDRALIESYCDNFFGYGSLDAPTWFIGMEEGGGRSLSEVATRIQTWATLGKRTTEDLFDYHRAIGVDEWFVGSRPKLQSTWNGLIRMQMGLESDRWLGLSAAAQTEAARDYQCNWFARRAGSECMVELLPMPSRSARDWLYSDIPGIPWLRDRQSYTAYQSPRRTRAIARLIGQHKPRAVVFTA